MERSLEYQTRHRKLLILQALRATVRLVSVSKGAEVRLAAAQMNRGGRPRLPIDAEVIAQLRGAGHSWRSIARQVGVGDTEPFVALTSGEPKLCQNPF